MGRGKLNMELIQNEKKRKVTYLKRSNGLMKKMYELTTLCDVKAFMILYGIRSDGQPNTEPETWPQDPNDFKAVFDLYKSKMQSGAPTKDYKVSNFFENRKTKIEADTHKLQEESLSLLYPTWDNSLDILGEAQLRNFITILDTKIEACNARLAELRKKEVASSSSASLTYKSDLMSNNSDLGFSYDLSLTPKVEVPIHYNFQFDPKGKQPQMLFKPFDLSIVQNRPVRMLENEIGWSHAAAAAAAASSFQYPPLMMESYTQYPELQLSYDFMSMASENKKNLERSKN
ncbi:MADS-box transcription factor [Quillaja saponaria]|uniref:MADS-box transcription factor n=1 Tax=Quillaja saponaria TaxID=32244 RepID=A0AAD7VMJ7_QUISA|nr:MADS-box transcription factor [Quillaja saponaria]